MTGGVETRIASAARAVGRPVEKTTAIMIPQLIEVAGELHDPVVFTDGNAGAIGMRVPLRVDDRLAGRIGDLQYQVTGSKALTGAVMARPGAIEIEIGVGSGGNFADGREGVFGSVLIEGGSTIAEDLDVLGALGITAEARAAMERPLRGLDPTVELRALGITAPYSRNTTLEIGVATPFGTDMPDAISFLGPPRMLRVSTTPPEVAPGVTFVWSDVPAEDGRRVVELASTTDGAAERFDAFLDALGSSVIRTLELTLAPEIFAWIGVGINDDRGVS